MVVTVHIPVMRYEVLDHLRGSQGGVFLDCTLGGGGHTEAILEANMQNTVVAIDRDLRALDRARERLARFGDRVTLHHLPFSRVHEVAITERFSGVLADLGVSTDQLREARGFSFHDSDSLDMRMDESQGTTAADFVNRATEQDLFRALKEGGVGSEARRVVQAIVRERPFTSARHLATVVNRSIGTTPSPTNPATVVFQAIRIAVNDEYEEIRGLLRAIPDLTKPGGRGVVISFHSLEDREVARTMREWEAGDTSPANWPGASRREGIGRLLTRKALTPTEDEIEGNPASRSARMRVFEFKE
jgi:16S rRNA (cytosine1402-N4)-methyltransferase